MGWVGTLVVARVPLDGRTTGDHKGPHSTTQPLPPLRGRSRFPCMLAKNLYLKDPYTPLDAINRVPTFLAEPLHSNVLWLAPALEHCPSFLKFAPTRDAPTTHLMHSRGIPL